jgi:transcription elongation factor
MIQEWDDLLSKREVRVKPEVLEARCRAPSTAQTRVQRARMVLLASGGLQYALDRQGSGYSYGHMINKRHLAHFVSYISAKRRSTRNLANAGIKSSGVRPGC